MEFSTHDIMFWFGNVFGSQEFGLMMLTVYKGKEVFRLLQCSIWGFYAKIPMVHPEVTRVDSVLAIMGYMLLGK